MLVKSLIRTNYIIGILADTLQVATIPVISNENCKRKYQEFCSIADSQICLLDEINNKTLCLVSILMILFYVMIQQ